MRVEADIRKVLECLEAVETATNGELSYPREIVILKWVLEVVKEENRDEQA